MRERRVGRHLKDSSGKLTAAGKPGITASGETLKFTGEAKAKVTAKATTWTVKLAGAIDFVSGRAHALKPSGTLILKHGGQTVNLKVLKVSSSTLTAKPYFGHQLKFPLDLSNAKAKANSDSAPAAVSVTGVVVKLSSADANALNNALGTSAFKAGGKLGTLSYDASIES